jgi:hypothetical protein
VTITRSSGASIATATDLVFVAFSITFEID